MDSLSLSLGTIFSWVLLLLQLLHYRTYVVVLLLLYTLLGLIFHEKMAIFEEKEKWPSVWDFESVGGTAEFRSPLLGLAWARDRYAVHLVGSHVHLWKEKKKKDSRDSVNILGKFKNRLTDHGIAACHQLRYKIKNCMKTCTEDQRKLTYCSYHVSWWCLSLDMITANKKY